MTIQDEHFEKAAAIATGGANFLAGLQFYPRLPDDIKEAVKEKSAEMHGKIEKVIEESGFYD